jgi:hypothetical protein
VTSDGFSVKTTISQMANVARHQAKGQTTQPVSPATDKQLKNEKRVDRVKRGEEVQKHKIDPDAERRRDRAPHGEREERDAPPATGEGEREETHEPGAGDDRGKGVVLDTTA